jgi:MSHA biogenesis protein MshE
MLRKIRIGDLLIEHNIIDSQQLENALIQQKETGAKLGEVLVRQGTIEEDSLLSFLAKQLNLPYLNLYHYPLKTEIVEKISEKNARRYRAIPIDLVNGSYLVAMADPTDLVAYDVMVKLLDLPLRIAVVKEFDLLKIIDAVFRRTKEIANLVGELEQEITDIGYESDSSEIETDAPIKTLLFSIFEDAVQVNASDIHIEPEETEFRIRQRVDGVLHEEIMQGKAIVSALILRLKLMAKLNISERRRPQDGRFSIQVKGSILDVRIATIPVQHGEAAVMRILDHQQNVKDLFHVGMNEAQIKLYKKHLHAPHGMILVTGPTGSGKSTTLYAGLLEVNSEDKKIITVEDPVEYRFTRMNQVQVQPQIDLTFSSVLRSVLRHDPDIIMVGEIRDEETATIALRSALTGHLVLSTLHTFDSINAPVRLIEMGVPAFLVASSVRCVIAQRLIRRICDSCQLSHKIEPHQKVWLSRELNDDCSKYSFKKGKGCPQCQNTGYKGRVGVFEVLEITEKMAEYIRNSDFSSFAKEVKESQFISYTKHALELAVDGVTSIDEVYRLAIEFDDDQHRGAHNAQI